MIPLINMRTFGKHIIQVPASPDALSYPAVWLVEKLAQLTNAPRDAACGKYYICAIIPLLIFSRVPFAIRRFIISVIFYPFNRHAFWRMAHVLKKVFKLQPSLTDFYSTPPIIFEVGSSLEIASVQHPSPYSKHSGPGTTVGLFHKRCSNIVCDLVAGGGDSIRRSLRSLTIALLNARIYGL